MPGLRKAGDWWLAKERLQRERHVIAATLWTNVAGLADRWLAAQCDSAAIQAFAREVLDRLGGPLFDGYLAGAPRPDITKPG